MINENFSIGYNEGLNALENISLENENPDHAILAGLLSSIANCVYYYAPSEKDANDLFKFAMDYAIWTLKDLHIYGLMGSKALIITPMKK